MGLLDIFNFGLGLLKQSGYAGVFVLMALESATLPVPSEVVLPLTGVLVYQGAMNFWLAVAFASAGSVVGTLIDYAIGFYLGRAAIIRYGKYVRIHEKQLILVEGWFSKYGPITVFLARFVPLIRTLVAFPAGIAEMRIAKFVAFSLVGIVAWDAVLIYLGYLAGQSYNAIISTLSKYFTEIGVISILIAAALIFIKWKSGTKEAKGPLRSQPKPEEGKGDKNALPGD
jgi:membrane protein DedA with SNARE-associated domain